MYVVVVVLGTAQQTGVPPEQPAFAITSPFSALHIATVPTQAPPLELQVDVELQHTKGLAQKPVVLEITPLPVVVTHV